MLVNFIGLRHLIETGGHGTCAAGGAAVSISSGAGMGYLGAQEKIVPLLELEDHGRRARLGGEAPGRGVDGGLLLLEDVHDHLDHPARRHADAADGNPPELHQPRADGHADDAGRSSSKSGQAFFDAYPTPIENRNATPEEQGWPLAFLNSDAASYVSGREPVHRRRRVQRHDAGRHPARPQRPRSLRTWPPAPIRSSPRRRTASSSSRSTGPSSATPPRPRSWCGSRASGRRSSSGGICAWRSSREAARRRSAPAAICGRSIPLLSGAVEPEDEWERALLADRTIATDWCLFSRPVDKPVISALNGDALGGGFELMLATDLRIAAEGIRLGLPEPKRGLVPGGGGVQRLPRQIPHAQAMELLLTADPIPAARALELGLINAVVPRDTLLEAALDLARRIAANAPVALQMIKRTLRETDSLPIQQAPRGRRTDPRSRLRDARRRGGPAGLRREACARLDRRVEASRVRSARRSSRFPCPRRCTW